MRVAIYVRVSTTEQAEEGYSIKAQIERLNAYALSQGWKVIENYIDDGQSAKDMNRTDLNRMLKDMKENKFDVVLVYKLDRLTRSVLDLYKLLEYFDSNNVKFKSATEVYDTTNAMGRLFITLVAALAQWERENLAERVKMGMEQKAKEGKWVINMAPIGYDLDGKDALKINEKEATIVKVIFEQYATGRYGMGKIAQMLNKKQIKTKSGANWGMQTIRYVLTNPVYIGTMRYNHRVNKEQYFEVENAVPAIIQKELYDEVQNIVNKRSTLHPRKATSPHIFAGVAKCVRCGARLSGKQWNYPRKPGEYYYGYYCPNHIKGICTLTNLSQNYLETQFIKYLSHWEYTHLIEDTINEDDTNQEEKQFKIESLQKELEAIKKRRSKWQYAWVNELITDVELAERLKEDEQEIEIIQRNIKDLQPKEVDNKPQIILSCVKDIQYNWSKLDAFEKRKLVEHLVQDIYIDKTDIKRSPESVKITDVLFK